MTVRERRCRRCASSSRCPASIWSSAPAIARARVALTFDDGPDPQWTPQILDILKRERVPATFFIVGENALTQRGLLERMVAEGHEVGSHTYTHPNLAGASDTETDIQLNATQRLFQAFTGRSLQLFRAPYFGDAEPTTADEIGPALQAQKRGYISVGLHVDAEDWQRPGVAGDRRQCRERRRQGDNGCASSDDAQCSHNIVLLHDAGGDRAQTVAALPIIIERLRAHGLYVRARLARSPAFRATSRCRRSRRATASRRRSTCSCSARSARSSRALGWLFLFAISIGILRAVLLSALALIQARRESRTVFPAIDPDRFVTVMIPAFNEEAVIERVGPHACSPATDVRIEVIVIDDGSKDRTSAIVAAAFADDPRVRLLTLENGGKARALNQGLELAKGEIVIALDADTQFEPTTIARLARWFADPKLGAVAGNAKVGNRVNLVTRWQALEYITAQNLERRALAELERDDGGAGRGRRVAAGGDPRGRRLSARHAGRGPGPDHRDPARGLAGRPTTNMPSPGPKARRRSAGSPSSASAGRTARCNACGSTARIMATGRPRGLAWVGVPQAIAVPDRARRDLADHRPRADRQHRHDVARGRGSMAGRRRRPDVDKMLAYWLIFTAIDLLCRRSSPSRSNGARNGGCCGC